MQRPFLIAACVAVALPLLACGSARSDDADGAISAPSSAATQQSDVELQAATTRAAERIPASRLGRPTAGAPRDRPRGLLFVIHGGGWSATDADELKDAVQWASGYRRVGWATYTLSMHSGEAAVRDAVAAYDRNRRRFGSKVPFCAIGASSGGHVALMLAARRPAMRCVIANAAPTDLPALFRDSPGNRPALQRGFPGAAAGLDSPTRVASRIKARVALTYAENDRDVPASQGREFYRRHPARTTLTILPAGGEFWTHSKVDTTELNKLYPRNVALLDSVARAAGR